MIDIACGHEDGVREAEQPSRAESPRSVARSDRHVVSLVAHDGEVGPPVPVEVAYGKGPERLRFSNRDERLKRAVALGEKDLDSESVHNEEVRPRVPVEVGHGRKRSASAENVAGRCETRSRT